MSDNIIYLVPALGIIGLLVSILVPALSKARDQANSVKCASNMRQLYLACTMAAQDSRGNLPRPTEVPVVTGSRGANGVAAETVCAWTHQKIGTPAGVADFENGVIWKYIGGLATRKDIPVKVLAKGEISKPLTVQAHAFSATARERIEAAGGTCTVLES